MKLFIYIYIYNLRARVVSSQLIGRAMYKSNKLIFTSDRVPVLVVQLLNPTIPERQFAHPVDAAAAAASASASQTAAGDASKTAE